MIFLRYESFRQYVRLYPVTSAILGIQLVLFAVMTVMGGSTDADRLLQFGAMFGFNDPQTGTAITPEWWRYAASVFLHNGFLHLLYNSFALFVFAPPLERWFGHARYGAFYLACGVVGNAATRWLQPLPYLSVGASGAVYGIFAAYLCIAAFRKDLLERAARQTVGVTVVIGLVYSYVTPAVNIYAHLGGLVGGFLLGAAIVPFLRKPQ